MSTDTLCKFNQQAQGIMESYIVNLSNLHSQLVIMAKTAISNNDTTRAGVLMRQARQVKNQITILCFQINLQ